MNEQQNKRLTPYAKKLRREMTKEERHLWYDFLRGLPDMVHRQKTIGNYIVDFYIASVKIVIELDGGQHYKNQEMIYDYRSDQYLKQNDVLVLRYPNGDIWRNFRGVCEDILINIERRKNSNAL